MLRAFVRTNEERPVESLANWRRIYVFSETEVDAVTEGKPQTTLEEYLANHDSIRLYISEDESTVYAVSYVTNTIDFCYELEKLTMSTGS